MGRSTYGLNDQYKMVNSNVPVLFKKARFLRGHSTVKAGNIFTLDTTHVCPDSQVRWFIGFVGFFIVIILNFFFPVKLKHRYRRRHRRRCGYSAVRGGVWFVHVQLGRHGHDVLSGRRAGRQGQGRQLHLVRR